MESNSKSSKKSRTRAPMTTEAREQKLCVMAMDLAEQQLRDGTASAQVISHYLKLATAREQLEMKKLQSEIELAKAKTRSIDSMEKIEKLYTDAQNAMKRYSGEA